jgi:hypothetical protein
MVRQFPVYYGRLLGRLNAPVRVYIWSKSLLVTGIAPTLGVFYQMSLLTNSYSISTPLRYTVKQQQLALYQTISDYFFSPASAVGLSKNSKWVSMEELINHFLFYAEGPCLPLGLSQGAVEAPKGHLGVSVVSSGSSKPVRARIRSSILVMAGSINNLVKGVGLGDFVVIVSASNIVVGEIDR